MNTGANLWAPIGQADMPTYQAAAEALERKNNGGIRLVGWTILRAGLIAPGFLILGCGWKKSIGGSFIASGLISALVLVRVAAAGRSEKTLP